jgi:hypothetical protein
MLGFTIFLATGVTLDAFTAAGGINLDAAGNEFCDFTFDTFFITLVF